MKFALNLDTVNMICLLQISADFPIKWPPIYQISKTISEDRETCNKWFGVWTTNVCSVYKHQMNRLDPGVCTGKTRGCDKMRSCDRSEKSMLPAVMWWGSKRWECHFLSIPATDHQFIKLERQFTKIILENVPQHFRWKWWWFLKLQSCMSWWVLHKIQTQTHQSHHRVIIDQRLMKHV